MRRFSIVASTVQPVITSREQGESAMTRPPIADRVSQLRPTAVNRVLAEVRAVQARGQPVVSLMRGQPDTPTAGGIIEAAQLALREGRTGYADNRGEPNLRAAIAEKLARDNSLRY